jgi:hypothetical protein
LRKREFLIADKGLLAKREHHAGNDLTTESGSPHCAQRMASVVSPRAPSNQQQECRADHNGDANVARPRVHCGLNTPRQ